jgi:trigger factor
MTQALLARARAFPGREKEMWDFYRNNQQAFAELRAPIYEEKVVDHILGLAKVEDRKVTAAELLKADEDEKLEPEAAAGPEAAPGPEPAPEAEAAPKPESAPSDPA